MKTIQNKGFTLIEILIVIAIMAIIASAILPNFIGLDKSARVATTKANLGALRTAVKMYRSQVGSYPDNLARLTSTSYDDAGATMFYLNQIPVELISSSSGKSTESNVADYTNCGWYYNSTDPHVRVNCPTMDSTWGTLQWCPGSW